MFPTVCTVWKFGSLAVFKVWEFGSLGVWEFGSLEVWRGCFAVLIRIAKGHTPNFQTSKLPNSQTSKLPNFGPLQTSKLQKSESGEGFCKFGSLEVWKFGSLDGPKFGSLEVWKLRNFQTSKLPHFPRPHPQIAIL